MSRLLATLLIVLSCVLVAFAQGPLQRGQAGAAGGRGQMGGFNPLWFMLGGGNDMMQSYMMFNMFGPMGWFLGN